jgi:hypothetical protein
LVVFAGCDEKQAGDDLMGDALNNPDTPAQPVLTVAPANIPATKTAGSYTITVTSNASWTAAVNSAATVWCTLSPPASATGNGAVVVNVAKNTTVLYRFATVTLTSGTLSLPVEVMQEAVPALQCAKCCWDGVATWVDCYVTNYAYPFDSWTTNTPVVWSGNDNFNYDRACSARNGRDNTAAIYSTGLSAVQLCKDLGPGWYLPAYEELINMSNGTVGSPENGSQGSGLLSEPYGNYWTSSDMTAEDGRFIFTCASTPCPGLTCDSNGSIRFHYKSEAHYVRCALRN